MDQKTHWETVYATRQPDELSWYQHTPHRSLELIVGSGVDLDSAIIDVGGGDSTLVDALLERGHRRVTVLDLSGGALARARTRLGPRAGDVQWLEGDVTRVNLPPASFDLWHDRAVFHFLTNADDRSRYIEIAALALKPAAALIIASFAPDGPARCSGLPVERYDAAALERMFSHEFLLERALSDVHRTPNGSEQRFTYAVLRRR